MVGPDEWVDTFLTPAYYQFTWTYYAQVLSDWVNLHNATATDELIQAYDGADGPGNDNLFAVYLGVECTDAHWPTNWNVLIDETLDAATPFTGSLEVRKLFPHAVLVAEPGDTTHAETPTGEDPCVDDTIGNYLATGCCRRATTMPSGIRRVRRHRRPSRSPRPHPWPGVPLGRRDCVRM